MASAAGRVRLRRVHELLPHEVGAARASATACGTSCLGTGVAVHVAYPPDTDTPGFERETLTKPPECHAASRAAGDALYSPESVAESALRSLEKGRYHLSSPDFGQNLLVASMAGLSPHPLPLAIEFFLAPFLAVAMRVFGCDR